MKSFTMIFLVLVISILLVVAGCALKDDDPLELTGSSPGVETLPTEVADEQSQASGNQGSGLTASLELVEDPPTREHVMLKFVLENSSAAPLYVLKWYTPLEGIAGEIFKVTNEGLRIPYQGILASRTPPTIDSYVFLEPGESVSQVVDLATSYDFSKPGVYTIEFISPRISHTAQSVEQIARDMDQLGPVRIDSTPLVIEIAGS
jgi:hypothetical protein